MVVKVAGGVIGLGLIGTGGVAFIKPEWLGINREIPWTPLSQDKDFNNKSGSYGNDKFGGKYKNYLTGLVGTNKSNNDSWWEKSFKSWKKDKDANVGLGKEFNGEIYEALKPSSGEIAGKKYLREVCDAIYKDDNNKVIASPGTGDTDKYKEADVWKYCSPLGEKPKTIFDNDLDKDKYKDGNKALIGKEETDRKKLISTTGNDKFWEIRNKEFKGIDGYSKIEETKDAFFTNAFYKDKSIKDICEIAYGKESASEANGTAEKPNKDKVIKYCSLEKQ